MISFKNKRSSFSIKKSLKSTCITIIAIMCIPSFFSIAVSFYHTRTYDNIITNVSRANTINLIAKDSLPNELWEIVCGKKEFTEGKQFELLDEIEDGINQMKSLTKSAQDRQRLEVAMRTRLTLLRNVSMMGVQMANGSSVTENERMLEEIRTITQLFSEIMQDYIVSEIETADLANSSTKQSSIILFIVEIIIIITAMIISVNGIIAMTNSVHNPISQMESLSSKIAHGDLTARLAEPHVLELNQLADNLNTMAAQIDILIEKNIQEQKNLQKAEMKALQAQITPHFLYNTFDTIIWLAEEGRIEEVVKITRAFSEFLRISLSRGHEWITVQQELDHVRNYLTIQKVRYADILSYEIETDPALNDFKMLKLVLQPLVENAIYHGIKNKRGRGKLKVSAHFTDDTKKFMQFSVTDDGAGFTEERLAQVKQELTYNSESMEQLTSVYGMYNVNKKLVLYYNNQTKGLEIETVHRKGSTISFIIPCILESGENNV